ncbi:MAG: translocation/assembly module TamB domain-containing protein, partial [Opitutaceae bacterium]|nr:translocation/assembly module TamB domain-containing protein [Verrucomicrobiales bacterium]
MKSVQNRLRRWTWRLLLAAVGFVFVLGVSLPLWFPWVLGPILRTQGIRYASHDRSGYSRLVLRDIQGEWNGTTVRAAQVDLALPLAWLRSLRAAAHSNEVVVSIRDWRVVVNAAAADPSTNAVLSTVAILDDVSTAFAGLRKWVPAATATNGVVLYGLQSLSIPTLRWASGSLDLRVLPVGGRPDVDLAVGLQTVEPMRLKIRWPDREVEGQAVVGREGRSWNVNGDLAWRTNHVALKAEFGPGDTWPRIASATIAGWTVPDDMVALKGYDQPVVSAAFAWTSNHFALNASARASAADARSLFPPPIELQASAHGDLESLVVDQVKVIAPGTQAVLAPVDVIRDGKFVLETATMRLTADLAELPFAPLSGNISGDVVLSVLEKKLSGVRFSVGGDDLRMNGVPVGSMRASGGLAWPELSLDELKFQLDESSSAVVAGRIDLLSRSITDASWRLVSTGPRGFLPGEIRYGELTSSGRLSGSFTNVTWSGELAATQVSLPGVKPSALAVSGRGDLAGSNLVSIAVRSGGSTLTVGADVKLKSGEGAATEIRLTAMTLARGGVDVLSLAGESIIRIRPDPTGKGTPAIAVSVDGLAWRGPGKGLELSGDVSWPREGQFKLNVAGLNAVDLTDFLTLSNRQFQIDNLTLSAGWSNGPVRGELALAGVVEDLAGEPLKAGLKIRMTDEGMEFDEFTMASRVAPVLTWRGRLPLTVSPGDTNGHWMVDKSLPFEVRATSAATTEFGLDLKSFGRFQMGEPQIELNVEGTLEKPVAELSVGAGFVVWRPAGTNEVTLPRLDDFRLRARVKDQKLELLTCAARIDGQPVTITGEWPLAADSPARLFSAGAWLNVEAARGRLEMKDVQAAPLARYWPKTLAPQGVVNVSVEMLPGQLFDGVITVTNLATRALGSFTPIREISAVIRLAGREARLESFVGQIGGQPVRMTGRATLPMGQPLRYEGNLTGTNVSLARSTGFLLRSDFDLRLVGGGDVPTVLSGDVILRDGLYVQNIGSLLKEGPEGAPVQPPYFSITDAPFASWKLDARIRGNQFLRMRTPVFTGVISGDFRLQGTLAEPVLIGDARTTSGRIIFPFGALDVSRAQASFSSNDQDGPKLLISAAGRNYRYDIRLDIKGPMNSLNVVFTSTPPLSSERILLMLTAGELPEQEHGFSGSSKAGRVVSFL